MPPAKRNIQKASQSRLFTFEGGAQPGSVPVYQGLAIGKQLNYSLGANTPVRIPSATRYGFFDIVERIRAQRGLPTLGVDNRLTRDRSDLYALAMKGCDIDLQLHIGVCTDPTDFGAFEKIICLESAVPTDYQTSELGALDGNQEAAVMETLPFEGINLYDIVPINGEEIAKAEIVQAIVGIALPDIQSCGDCGLPTDGSQIAFAVSRSHGGSPGLAAKLFFTEDGWQSVNETEVTSLPANHDPSGIAVVGIYVVVISAEDNSYSYAPMIDILNAEEVWVSVNTGLVNGPTSILSLGAAYTWMTASGGYIYFTDDITAGVVVQSDGSATSENLVSLAAFDSLHLIAMGANNALLSTTNGGSASWTAITGPTPAVQLNCGAMKLANLWIVGTAGGELWYTEDGGFHWTALAFPSSGTGVINAMAFSTPTVGYFTHTVGGRGYLLRTVSGGAKWYRVPEAAGRNLPDNDSLTALAVVAADFSKGPNYALVGGLGANASDGILIKVA